MFEYLCFSETITTIILVNLNGVMNHDFRDCQYILPDSLTELSDSERRCLVGKFTTNILYFYFRTNTFAH